MLFILEFWKFYVLLILSNSTKYSKISLFKDEIFGKKSSNLRLHDEAGLTLGDQSECTNKSTAKSEPAPITTTKGGNLNTRRKSENSDKLFTFCCRIMVQWHKIVAIFLPSVVESVCTMFFVLIGCGSTISWQQEETGPNLVSKSLCFGLSYAFLVNISTCFSGGFLNPAITLALVANKTLSVTRAFCYILAQVLGAVTGVGLLYIIVPSETHGLLGMTQMKTVQPLVGFGVELLLTLIMTLTVLTCTDGGQGTVDHSASLVIGLAVTACHLFGYPVSGCGINPARSFGPAAIKNKWTDHWVYWFGPIIGALFASGIYHLANHFPVTTVDELVITGKEIQNKAASAQFEQTDNNQPLSQVDMQTQTPYELKTTV